MASEPGLRITEERDGSITEGESSKLISIAGVGYRRIVRFTHRDVSSSASDQFPEEFSGVALPHLGDLLGSAVARPVPRRRPLRAEVDDMSTDLMTSRLCSITTTVLPASTSRWRTWSSFRMSSKCRPVVGSSRM